MSEDCDEDLLNLSRILSELESYRKVGLLLVKNEPTKFVTDALVSEVGSPLP